MEAGRGVRQRVGGEIAIDHTQRGIGRRQPRHDGGADLPAHRMIAEDGGIEVQKRRAGHESDRSFPVTICNLD